MAPATRMMMAPIIWIPYWAKKLNIVLLNSSMCIFASIRIDHALATAVGSFNYAASGASTFFRAWQRLCASFDPMANGNFTARESLKLSRSNHEFVRNQKFKRKQAFARRVDARNGAF